MDRRRNYFIKKKFQSDFFIKFVALLLLEAVLIAALFMFIARGTLVTAYHGAELTIQKTGAYFLSYIFIMFIVAVGIGIAGVFVFMFLTHRIGGPLYKIEKTIEEAQSGNIAQRVQLRNTDQLFGIRNSMNTFLAEMDDRISRIKADVEKGIDILGKDHDPGNVSKVKELLGNVKSSLDHFKTSE